MKDVECWRCVHGEQVSTEFVWCTGDPDRPVVRRPREECDLYKGAARERARRYAIATAKWVVGVGGAAIAAWLAGVF